MAPPLCHLFAKGEVPRLGRYVVALFNEEPQYLNNRNANVPN